MNSLCTLIYYFPSYLKNFPLDVRIKTSTASSLKKNVTTCIEAQQWLMTSRLWHMALGHSSPWIILLLMFKATGGKNGFEDKGSLLNTMNTSLFSRQLNYVNQREGERQRQRENSPVVMTKNSVSLADRINQ